MHWASQLELSKWIIAITLQLACWKDTQLLYLRIKATWKKLGENKSDRQKTLVTSEEKNTKKQAQM